MDQAAKIDHWKAFVADMSQSAAERAAARAAEEEKKSKVTVEDSNWSKEDIAMLTKAIVRFPPGTGRRWQVIADFCGNYSQKEVIKKAQELATKRQTELEENRAATERKAEERKVRADAAFAAASQQENVQRNGTAQGA